MLPYTDTYPCGEEWGGGGGGMGEGAGGGDMSSLPRNARKPRRYREYKTQIAFLANYIFISFFPTHCSLPHAYLQLNNYIYNRTVFLGGPVRPWAPQALNLSLF